MSYMVINMLKYPKSLFTKKEVLDEKKGHKFPKAWNFKSSKKSYTLTFDEKKAKKYYSKKKR